MKCKRLFRALLLSSFCFIAVGLYAQKPQGDAMLLVKVTIVDTQKNPLPGATAKVVGKSQGVIADANGGLSLWVAKDARLEFSYIGMNTLSMKVTKPLSGFITLEDKTSELDQVVVTGYQRTTKRRTTGSYKRPFI